MNTTAPIQVTAAGLGRRLMAGVYDLLPLLGLWFIADVLALLLTGGALDPHTYLAHKLLVQIFVLTVTLAYFVISWTRGGQTIGMRAWRLRLVRADGSRVDAVKALQRFFAALLSLVFFGLGFWWALFDSEKRTWHDIATGTRLVRI